MDWVKACGAIRIETKLMPKTATANDSFRGTLVSNLRENDYVALPAGAPVASSGPKNTLNFRELAQWAFWWTQSEQLILWAIKRIRLPSGSVVPSKEIIGSVYRDSDRTGSPIQAGHC